MAEPTVTEQRKWARYPCAVPVEGKEGSSLDGLQTFDISRRGLGFVSVFSIPLKERIVIQLDFSETDGPFLVLGEVKWVRRMAGWEGYRIGMNFVRTMDRGTSSRLQRYFPR